MVLTNHTTNGLIGLLVFYTVLGLKVCYLVYTGQIGQLVEPSIVSNDITPYFHAEHFIKESPALPGINSNYLMYTTYMSSGSVITRPVIPDYSLCASFNLVFHIGHPFDVLSGYYTLILDVKNNLDLLLRNINHLTGICEQLNIQFEDAIRECNRRGYDTDDGEDFVFGQMDMAKCYVRGLRVMEQLMRQFNSDYVSTLPVLEFEN